MVSTIVYQLTRGLSTEDIKKAGFDTYFVDHTTAVYPQAASGEAFSANTFAVSGDMLADLHEDLAAEQKARLTYDNILRYADDPDVRDPIKFLRAREVVHYQRFGEAKRTIWKQPVCLFAYWSFFILWIISFLFFYRLWTTFQKCCVYQSSSLNLLRNN